MRSAAIRVLLLLALPTLAACGQAVAPTPTAAPAPTHTPIPPATPPAPAFEPEPATITVCAQGCDVNTVQAAIDDPGTLPGAVISVTDPVHTEAGITVHKDVTIQGLGAGRTTVQGHAVPGEAADRVFLVPEGTTAAIKGLTIRHGYPTDPTRCGGGVSNFGTLLIEKCVVRDNSANEGGGLFNQGDLTLLNTTIHGNLADKEAPPGYECGSGGGLKNGFRGTVTVENCTFSGNEALGKGGGVFVACEGAARFTNCTFSGNRTVGNGGGVYAHGPTELVHCTVAENRAGGSGGGIYIRDTLSWCNCLVANNTKQDVHIGGEGGYKGMGSINMHSHNWVADRSCESDHSGDPLLGPLSDNGGDTLTHALLMESPAVDLIPVPECPVPYDQRGETRPLFISSLEPVCDVGAFEWQP